MASIPFKDVKGLQVSATRWQTLPSAGFRTYGGGYTESSGRTEDVSDTLALLGGDVKYDTVAEKVEAKSESPIVTQMKMKTKAVAFTFNDTFFNGDQGVNPDAFEGLKKRVSNMPARQTIDLASSTDSLKILASAANEKLFLDALHQAIKVVDGATHIFCNENTWIKFGSVLRDLGLSYNVVELYDRRWETFAGVPLVDVGLKSDKSTEIITSTEDPGDGGNDATSIYVARMDTDDGLCGIQLAGTSINVYDPLNGNEMEAGPQRLRRIDWAVGLTAPSQYSICRIKGFKMAAS
ncbi:conserved hypothetical protein [Gammaproteobacteria bacterium]